MRARRRRQPIRRHTGTEGGRGNTGDVEPILNNLRLVSNDYKLPVAVVHHGDKGNTHPLRGSSSFEGWYDFLLWPKGVNRLSGNIDASLRDAESPDPFGFAVKIDKGNGTACVTTGEGARAETPDERHGRAILEILNERAPAPVPNAELRKSYKENTGKDISGLAFNNATALLESRRQIRNTGAKERPVWALTSAGMSFDSY